jgi:hypothetical protein
MKSIEIKVDNKQAIKAIKEVIMELEKVKQSVNATGLLDFMKWQTNKVNHLKSKQRKAARIIAAQKVTIDDLSNEIAYYRGNRQIRARSPCDEHDCLNPNLPDRLNVIGKGDNKIGYFRKRRI